MSDPTKSTGAKGERANPLDVCVCANVRLAARRLTHFYEKRLAPAGVSISQFSLLAQIGALRNGAIAEIAARLELDPSTLSRTLKPLEDAGLAVVAADPDNRRVRRVKLTDSGKAKVKEAGALWMLAQKEASEAVPADMLGALGAAVAKLS